MKKKVVFNKHLKDKKKKKRKEKKKREMQKCSASRPIWFSHVGCYLPRGTVEVLRESRLQV